MSWWQITLIVIVALVALFFIVGYSLPSSYTITRQGTIEAPPEAIYNSVATPKSWNDWSGWNTRNYPDIKFTYEGPETGKDASMSWTSASVGNGQLVVTQADPAKGMEYDLFMEGSKLGTGEIRVEPDGKGTKVTWIGHCDFANSIVGRYCAYLLNFNKLLGDDFNKGIAGLKTLHEGKEPAKPMGEAPMPESPAPPKAETSATPSPAPMMP